MVALSVESSVPRDSNDNLLVAALKQKSLLCQYHKLLNILSKFRAALCNACYRGEKYCNGCFTLLVAVSFCLAAGNGS